MFFVLKFSTKLTDFLFLTSLAAWKAMLELTEPDQWPRPASDERTRSSGAEAQSHRAPEKCVDRSTKVNMSVRYCEVDEPGTDL